MTLLLILVSVLTGVLTTQVVKRTTDGAAVRRTRNRIHAHWLEFRLFFDEPALIWNAQTGMAREYAQLACLLLPSVLVLILPMAWLFLQLETLYGVRPLRPGEPAVVTAQLTRPIESRDRFDLQASPGIAVETAPVRIMHDRQVVWRIRPAAASRGTVALAVNGASLTKAVAAGDSTVVLSPRRSRSMLQFLLHPEEPRLPPGDVEWLEIRYSEASAAWLGWFLLISMISALVCAKW